MPSISSTWHAPLRAGSRDLLSTQDSIGLLCAGAYNLPAGSYEITLQAADSCTGSGFCTTLVTVADQEALHPALLSCGALPANGVLDIRPPR